MNSPVITRRAAQKAKIQTRARVKSSQTSTTFNTKNSIEQRKPNTGLLEAKRRARLLKMQQQNQHQSQPDSNTVKDIFQNAIEVKHMIQKPTGLIYDERMSEHRCLWDDKHPECPERFTRIIERCHELKLIERCKILPSRRATKSEILRLHSEEHYNLLEQTSNIRDDDKMEDLSSKYDSIYIHPSTFDLALLATGSTIDLIDNIIQGTIQNGMAIIRPPGHHAMKCEFNGYCFFNNVALATQHALDVLKLKRILIIDWDIHHGQGIQNFFYNDPRVLYFSIHRYEYGTFWPNLKESDFDAIGCGAGLGYNFNIPLNKPGMGNGDYLAIFQQILIPVAMEFQPKLIIVSAGYDAALGCPEGQMEVTPALYSHLINHLLKLANSRVAVILEGGYCLDSLSEGAALTLRALLDDSCPTLVEKLEPPCPSVQESILNSIFVHRNYWKCLQLQNTYTMEELNNTSPQLNFHKINRIFIGGPPLPERFPTRNTLPVIPPEIRERNALRLQRLKAETKLLSPQIRLCYVYDELMLQHTNMYEKSHPEQPERIRKIYEMHHEYKLLERMNRLPSRLATTDEICLAHTRSHVNFIRRTQDKNEILQDIGANYNSVYFHPKTYECATLASGSVLQVVDKVVTGEARSGICIVRPPGHHAESDIPHGFCIFNNVAIAAQYALRKYGLQRILIVDWDVHHGNGTQHIFERNPQVLYISVHRYDNGGFFPKSKDGDYDAVGKGAGIGFNVNIPWNKKGMGDFEYILAFQHIIMPIAYEFDPQLILISAGFDAAIGDPLGGCKVTPEAYGLFTHWLSALANGRIIVCLEGGYNVHSISYAMTMCSKALLGDPIPLLQISNFHNSNNTQTAATTTSVQSSRVTPTIAYNSCLETIQNCINIQQKYWKSLVFNKRLPNVLSTIQNVEKAKPDEQNNKNRCRSAEEIANADTDAATAAATIMLNKLHITSGEINDCSDTARNVVESPTENVLLPRTNEMDMAAASTSGSKPNVKTLNEFLTENLQALQNNEMFAVVPLNYCPHLKQLCPEQLPKSINTSTPCNECASLVENWMCLTCYKILCGRYVMEHMLHHSMNTMHPLALSFTDLSIWCYPCEAYVDNKLLYNYKNLAYRDKFGEDMIWPYGEEGNRHAMDIETLCFHNNKGQKNTLNQQEQQSESFYVNLHDNKNDNNNDNDVTLQHDHQSQFTHQLEHRHGIHNDHCNDSDSNDN